MFDNANHTELSSLGEFGLINHLNTSITIKNPSTKLGIGDDAAVIDFENKETVVSTDMLVEGVHFDLMYMPMKHLGYKAMAVNFSDIFAMNATPKQVLVSIAISSKFSLEAIEELYNGMRAACDLYGVDLVGGDTTSSNQGMVISITAIGEAEKETTVKRSGAKEHDLIVVSGDLGGAYMGLQVLEREKAVFKSAPQAQPDLEGMDYILERQLKPEPRADIIRLLHDADVRPTSMIDISDGLASELLHIAKSSDCGIRIYIEKLPIDHVTRETAEQFNLDPTVAALNGGEDYELLFTISQTDYDKLKDKRELSIIGHVVDKTEGTRMITEGGNEAELTAQGWTSF